MYSGFRIDGTPQDVFYMEVHINKYLLGTAPSSLKLSLQLSQPTGVEAWLS